MAVGRKRNLACAMIEIRNDEIAAETGQRKWAELLGTMLAAIAVPTDDARDDVKQSLRPTR